jgi:hypothetical protein
MKMEVKRLSLWLDKVQDLADEPRQFFLEREVYHLKERQELPWQSLA